MAFGGRVAAALSVARPHIVAIATLGSLVFGWIFTGHFFAVAALACAVDWFVVNLLNRVVDLPEDQANAVAGTSFVVRNKRAILFATLALLLVSAVASHIIAPAMTPLRVGYHALGAAYNWRLLPGARRIKELYFWKNSASATGFLLTVIGYPLAESASGGALRLAPDVTVATIAWTAAFFFLFEVSFEVLYDLRDLKGDAAVGARTYAVVHGARAAAAIVHGLVAASIVVLVTGYALEIVPWRAVVMIVAPVVQGLYARHAVRRGVTSADCVRLTWIGAALLFTSLVWVALGLPVGRRDARCAQEPGSTARIVGGVAAAPMREVVTSTVNGWRASRRRPGTIA